jgi:alanine racemase
VAVVDLDAIAHNVVRLRAVAAPAQVMAVVKADAYGHGLVPCARAAQEAGAAWLGTAYVEEALALRAAGIAGPVLAFVCLPGADLGAAVRADVDVAVGSVDVLAATVAAAHEAGRPARVHLEADTGLSRGGATAADWPALVSAAAAAEAEGAVTVVAVWSHFACADEPGHPSISMQQQCYSDALVTARTAGLRPQLHHLANSAATFTLPDARYDLVRAGIATYGVSPGAGVGSASELGLRAAMTVRSRLAAVKRVPAGAGVSYGHTYVTDRDTVLGLVPLGYGDGLPRAASGTGPVLVGAVRATVAGRICMDQLVVDLGPDSAASVGDPVVLFGEESQGFPTAEDWASTAGTIGYEIVTRLQPRLPRVHVRGGR